MFYVINDALYEHTYREAKTVGEAIELMLEDMAWFKFYCLQEASTAKNDKEAVGWRQRAGETEIQMDIAKEIPPSLIANSGLVLFVGSHLFKIRVEPQAFRKRV